MAGSGAPPRARAAARGAARRRTPTYDSVLMGDTDTSDSYGCAETRRLRTVVLATSRPRGAGETSSPTRTVASTSSGGLPEDPMYELGGLARFGASLRSGKTTAAAVTKAYLARITALEPQLQCFEVVLAKEAEAAASAIDTLLAAGTDLGRLMGACQSPSRISTL